RGSGAAGRARGEDIRRTRPRTPRAGLRDIALAGGGAADETRALEDVDAGVAGSGAVVGRVVIARPALRGSGAARRARGEDIVRTRARASRAALRDIALAGGGAADEGRAL